MFNINWLKNLKARHQKRQTARDRQRRRNAPRVQLGLETLETRQVMAANVTATLLPGGVLSIEGTEGNDTVFVRQINNQVSVAGLKINSNGQQVSSIAAGQIQRIELLGLAGNDTLKLEPAGAGGKQGILIPAILYGGEGNDTLTGGAGNDTLIGGNGNDAYSFNTNAALGSDTIVEAAGGGTDRLDFGTTTTLGITLDLAKAGTQTVNSNLALTLSAGNVFENLTGGALDDVLTGNSLANVLTGGAGNDTLSGGSGNDTLTGGGGTDTLSGGDSDDLYLFNVDLPLGLDRLVESLTGGGDTLTVTAAAPLGADVDLASTAVQTINGNLQLALSAGGVFENASGNALAAVGEAARFLPSGFHLATVADLDHNGSPDYVLQHNLTGQGRVVFMQGGRQMKTEDITTPGDPWSDIRIAGAGDFNRDGRADLVFELASSGDKGVWQMNGAQRTDQQWFERPSDSPQLYSIGGVGDFNGDGRADLALNYAVNGDKTIWVMHGMLRDQAYWVPRPTDSPANYKVVGAGDFNRDGKADLVIDFLPTGRKAVWLMTAPNVRDTAVWVTESNDDLNRSPIVAAADISFDGTTDLIVYDPDEQNLKGLFMDGTRRIEGIWVGGHTVDATWNAGVVTVIGTDKSDDIAIRSMSNGIAIVSNGTFDFFPNNMATHVVVRGRGGDDIVRNLSGLSSVLSGENGNDTLTGGSAADRLTGGAGDDLLTGGGGNDVYVFDADAPLGTDAITEAVDGVQGGTDRLDFWLFRFQVRRRGDLGLATGSEASVSIEG